PPPTLMTSSFFSEKTRRFRHRQPKTPLPNVFVAISTPALTLSVLGSSETDHGLASLDVRHELSPLSSASSPLESLFNRLSRSKSRSRSRKRRSRSPSPRPQIRPQPTHLSIGSWVEVTHGPESVTSPDSHATEDVPNIFIEVYETSTTPLTSLPPTPDSASSSKDSALYQPSNCSETSSPPSSRRSLSPNQAPFKSRSSSPGLMESPSKKALTQKGNSDLTVMDSEEEPPRGRPMQTKFILSRPTSVVHAGYDLQAEKTNLIKAIRKNTKNFVHDVFTTGIELLDFVPVPGVKGLAKTVLNIWDAVERVEQNQEECINLLRRCTDILCCLENIKDAGPVVIQRFSVPFDELYGAFASVENFILSQDARQYPDRYLNRDDFTRELKHCEDKLDQAYQKFQISMTVYLAAHTQINDHTLKVIAESIQALTHLTKHARHPCEVHHTVHTHSAPQASIQPFEDPLLLIDLSDDNSSEDLGEVQQTHSTRPAMYFQQVEDLLLLINLDDEDLIDLREEAVIEVQPDAQSSASPCVDEEGGQERDPQSSVNVSNPRPIPRPVSVLSSPMDRESLALPNIPSKLATLDDMAPYILSNRHSCTTLEAS
ncbi:hypothetical protein BDN72DRAFT_848209, partial [Pluteus cervinus]